MQSYTLNRPDGALLCRVLEQHTNDAAGAILRLAWMAGLMRDEIQHLTWAQVDLLGEQLLLPDRAVPLAPELAAWLEALRQERNGSSERVVLSDRDQQPLAAQSISRLARAALDAGDLKAVRLIDLRHDYVLRQLERHDWQYVSRITGLEAAAMNVHFAAYLTEKKVSTRIRRKAAPQIDEFALWKLLQAEQDTPAGAALWLTWQLGLQVEEIASLRWDQVDLQKERLILPDRQVRLTSGVLSILQKLRKAAPPEAEWVLMPPRSRRPYERTRLSKLVRAALVQGGLDDLSLRDLRLDYDIRVGGENQVLDVVRRQGSITRNEVMALLRVSKNTAYNRLRQMVARGKLTKVGNSPARWCRRRTRSRRSWRTCRRRGLPTARTLPGCCESALASAGPFSSGCWRSTRSPRTGRNTSSCRRRRETGQPRFPASLFFGNLQLLLHKLPRIRRF